MIQNSILVIDDSRTLRTQISDILHRNGYHVSTEGNGKSGYKNAKSNSYDLILLDVIMPDISGFELIQKLKSLETNKNTPIIFLTGVGDQENLVHGLKLGASDYITKPFCEEVLLARIETWIKLNSTLEMLEKEIKEKEALFKIAERHNKDLLDANTLKEKLIAILAHDIKNPIISISRMSDLLFSNYDKLTSKRIKEILNLIHTSTTPISELIDNILAWANLSKTSNTNRPRVFRLKPIIDKCIEINRLYSQTKKITIKSFVDDKVAVYADEYMISTVFRNLISNAIKFNIEGGEVLISNNEITLEKKQYHEISVEDTGTGIDPGLIPHLFGSSNDIMLISGTKDEKGIGLGLKICKEYVERNSGKIDVKSIKGKGAKFTFTVPISLKKS
jgi:two-component system, sensor histidine kinase and response regulator